MFVSHSVQRQLLGEVFEPLTFHYQPIAALVFAGLLGNKMSRVAPAPDDFDGRIAALESQKAAAVSREDFGQAHSIKGQIEALKFERSEARAPTARRLAELQQQKADAVRFTPSMKFIHLAYVCSILYDRPHASRVL